MSEQSGSYKEARTTGEKRAPRLREQVHEAIRGRYFSRRTEEAYVHWIKRFIYFSGRRHPAELGEPEVTAFLNHLAAERQVAASTQNQALSALLSPGGGRQRD
jgi:site-specific recombinase XerD